MITRHPAIPNVLHRFLLILACVSLFGSPALAADARATDAALIAACSGNVPDSNTVARLIRKGADVNSNDAEGWTPLLCAVSKHYSVEQERTIDLLLKFGAEVNCRDPRGMTPLMIAADWRNTRIARLLISHGANLDVQDIRGRTALMLAAGNEFLWGDDDLDYAAGGCEIYELLLAMGANADLLDHEGHNAAWHKNEADEREKMERKSYLIDFSDSGN